MQDYFCPNCYIDIFPFQHKDNLVFNKLALASQVNDDKKKKGPIMKSMIDFPKRMCCKK